MGRVNSRPTILAVSNEKVRTLERDGQSPLWTKTRAGICRDTEEAAELIAARSSIFRVSNQQVLATITGNPANVELETSSIAQIEFRSAGPEAIDRSRLRRVLTRARRYQERNQQSGRVMTHQ